MTWCPFLYGAGLRVLDCARLSGRRRRYHLHESVLQKSVKTAVRAAGLATCHSLRHSFARQLLRTATTIQELLGQTATSARA